MNITITLPYTAAQLKEVLETFQDIEITNDKELKLALETHIIEDMQDFFTDEEI